MKMSRRALRMERHHGRNKDAASISLVSMMDIFTILVFFLLINSSEVDALPSAKMIALPESSAEQRPRETVVVMVTRQDILVQGRRVIGVEEALSSGQAGIPVLSAALEELALHKTRALEGEARDRSEVTIMGAKDLPYQLLKKVMLACTQAKYGQVSFAVLQKAAEAG